MTTPQYIVLDMNHELQEFRNRLAGGEVVSGLIDVWNIQRQLLECVLNGCEDWEKSFPSMCGNSMAVLSRNTERHVFDARLDFYITCTDFAAKLHKKLELHTGLRRTMGGEFHYKFEKCTRNGLLVLTLNWDKTARAA